MLMTLTASAQFEKGKKYIGGSLTGLNMNYTGADKFCFGVQAQGGYFFADDLMLLGQAGYSHKGSGGSDMLNVGVGARYYIEQNGIYLGANCNLQHCGSRNDFVPGVEVGYAFFLNNCVTVEPAIYYNQSFRSHSDNSEIGLRIGLGVYLFKK